MFTTGLEVDAEELCDHVFGLGIHVLKYQTAMKTAFYRSQNDHVFPDRDFFLKNRRVFGVLVVFAILQRYPSFLGYTVRRCGLYLYGCWNLFLVRSECHRRSTFTRLFSRVAICIQCPSTSKV